MNIKFVNTQRTSFVSGDIGCRGHEVERLQEGECAQAWDTPARITAQVSIENSSSNG